jgi:hypothetical protein
MEEINRQATRHASAARTVCLAAWASAPPSRAEPLRGCTPRTGPRSAAAGGRSSAIVRSARTRVHARTSVSSTKQMIPKGGEGTCAHVCHDTHTQHTAHKASTCAAARSRAHLAQLAIGTVHFGEVFALLAVELDDQIVQRLHRLDLARRAHAAAVAGGERGLGIEDRDRGAEHEQAPHALEPKECDGGAFGR